MTSVIVPAHDEETTIGSCLSALLAKAEPSEFEIIVVCNGCTDGTADVVRSFEPHVRLLETATASKVAAINLGDEEATTYPRIYVDGDVQLDTESLRQLRDELLEDGSVHAVSPTPIYDLAAVPRRVAAYYRVWQRLPSVATSLVGAGVYGVSERGHRRIAPFPELLGDDFYVNQQFGTDERLRVPNAWSRVTPVRTIAALVRRRVRVQAGNVQASHQRYQNDVASIATVIVSALRADRRAWVDVPVYLGVTGLARSIHAFRRHDVVGWGRARGSR